MKTLTAIKAILLLSIGTATSAQPLVSKPEVGKPMNEFSFRNVRNYSKKRVSLEDFRGKWLFLEMWSASCKSCLAGFPKIQRFQDEFPEQVQFFLVGWNTARYNKGIEKMYENAVRNRNFRIPTAFDSTVFTEWEVSSVPRIFVVDPAGVLRFVTSGSDRDMTVEKIRDLISGKAVSFLPMDNDVDSPEFDPVSTFGEDNLISCSVLTRWKGEEVRSAYDIDVFERLPELWKPGWKISRTVLFELYQFAYLGRAFWMWYDSAYYGKIYALPLLELRDTSAFQYDLKVDIGKGVYNYCLKLPDSKVNRRNIMNELQRTLDHAFGYKASIENREMPVWKLVANPGVAARLRTRRAHQFESSGTLAAGFKVRNCDMLRFLALASANIPNRKRLAYIDETGIQGNIDITVTGDLTTLETTRKALQKHGLDIVKGSKVMKVLVIRGPD